MSREGEYPETADIETASDGYARRFSGPVGEWMLEVQTRLTLDLLREWPGASVLDVGGGHGQLAAPLSRAGWRMTVLGSAESCRDRIRGLVEKGQCRFVTGNVIALPFEDRAFDVALSFRLLPHCERWPTLIRELCRVARHAVIVDYPTTRSVNAIAPWLFGAKKKIEGNTRAWRMFAPREVAEAFRACGFQPGRAAKEFFFPMALHRMIKTKPLSAGLERAARACGLTALLGSPVILRSVFPENGVSP